MGWLDKIFGKRHLYKGFVVDGKAIAKANADVVKGKKDAEGFFSELLFSSWYLHFPELAELASYLEETDRSGNRREQFDSEADRRNLAAKLLRIFGTVIEKANTGSCIPKVESLNHTWETGELFNVLASWVEDGDDEYAYNALKDLRVPGVNGGAPSSFAARLTDYIPKHALGALRALLNPKLTETQKASEIRRQLDALNDGVHEQVGKDLDRNTFIILQPNKKPIEIKLTAKGELNIYEQALKLLKENFEDLSPQDIHTILNFSCQAMGIGLFLPAITKQLGEAIAKHIPDESLEHRANLETWNNDTLLGKRASQKEEIQNAFKNPSNEFFKYYNAGNAQAGLPPVILGSSVAGGKKVFIELDENQRLKKIHVPRPILLTNQVTAAFADTPDEALELIARYTVTYEAPKERVSEESSSIAGFPGNQRLGNFIFRYEALNDLGNLLLRRNVSPLTARFANPIKQYLHDNYKWLLAGGAVGATILVATPFLWPAYLAFAVGFVAVEIVLALSPVIGSILGAVVVEPAKRAINWLKARFSSSSKQELELTAEPLIQKADLLAEPASTGKMFQTTAIPQLIQAIALIYMVGLKHSWEDWIKYREGLLNQTLPGLKENLRSILARITDPQKLLGVYTYMKTNKKYPSEVEVNDAKARGLNPRKDEPFSKEDIDAFSKHIHDALTDTKPGAVVIPHAKELAEAFFKEGPQGELIKIITAIAQEYPNVPEMKEYMPPAPVDEKQKGKADELNAPAALLDKSLRELQEAFANQLTFISRQIDSEVDKARGIAKKAEELVDLGVRNGAGKFSNSAEAQREKTKIQTIVQECQQTQEITHAIKLQAAFAAIGGHNNPDVIRHVKLATDGSSAQAKIIEHVTGSENLTEMLAKQALSKQTSDAYNRIASEQTTNPEGSKAAVSSNNNITATPIVTVS